MPLLPLLPYLLVARADTESVTPGGIVLPDAAQKAPRRGTVLAVYEEGWDLHGFREPKVTEGDVVIFKSHAGDEVKIGDNTYLFVNENDVMGVISAGLPGLPAKEGEGGDDDGD